MYIKKNEDKPSSLPVSGGAVRRGTETETATDGTSRRFRTADQIPGLVMEELQHGEEPHGFPSNGTDERFSEFENAVVSAIAWANEVPPNILRLGFSHNYSASQGEINEFRMYLNRIRSDFGASFCQPVYVEWLISEALSKRIDAPGLLDANRSGTRHDIFGAWTACEWSGAIKPSTDLLKQGRGYEVSIAKGLITNQRVSRELHGMKYSRNMRILRKENEQFAEAMAPLAEFRQQYAQEAPEGMGADMIAETVRTEIESALEDAGANAE